MSDTKHTPGPWRVERSDWLGNDAGHKIYITGDHGVEHGDDGERLETCAGVAIAEGNATSREVTEANARLIAAAPELLAELQRLEWVVAGGQTYCPSCDYVYAAGHAEDCRLAAVLDKVTGEDAR